MLLLGVWVGIVGVYRTRAKKAPLHPGPCARLYAPFGLTACFAAGLGAMACLMSGDTVLAVLAIMAPLFLYLGAMTVVVRRHYKNLVALMTAEQGHAEIAARFDAALAHMPHGLCTIDAAGKVVIANRKAAELFGATVDMLRLNVSLPDFIGFVGLANFGDTLRAQLIERCAAWLRDNDAPLDLTLADGHRLELSRNAVPDGSVVIIIEDVTERRKTEARILHWAHHDSLTGLPNHCYFADHAERLMASGTGHEKAMVMYVDLDGFKHVNDSHGHNAGDDLLRRGELAARLGGDEFAIVATVMSEGAGAAFAKKIIEAFQARGRRALQSQAERSRPLPDRGSRRPCELRPSALASVHAW